MKTIRIPGDGAKKLAQALQGLKDKEVKVGWFSGQTYPEPPYETVASIAYQNEMGNPLKHIPARPFIRPAVKEYSGKWGELFARGARSVLLGRTTPFELYEKLGFRAAADTQGAIINPLVPWAPLSEITIAMRLARRADHSTLGNLWKPLVDTGLMLATLIHSVEDVGR